MGAGPVSVFGSITVLNRRAPGGYRLAELVGDDLRDLAVPARRVPFDVDVGPGVDGTVTAVYSRCRTEPTFGDFTDTYAYRTGVGCRLFSARVRGGREKAVAVPAPRNAATSRFLPTIWQDRMAWAETEDHRRSDAGNRIRSPRLMLRKGAGAARALKGGSDFDPRSTLSTAGPLNLDLRAGRLTFAWRFVSRDPQCRGRGGVDITPASEAWTVRAERTRRLLVRAGCAGSEAGTVLSATAAGPTASVLQVPQTSEGLTSLVRYTADGHRVGSHAVPGSEIEPPIAAALLPDGRLAEIRGGQPLRLVLTRNTDEPSR